MASEDFGALLGQGREAFKEAYGRDAKFFGAAPGRVNLIGEHVDYCDGLVFPMAIDKRTLCVGAPREGQADGDGDFCSFFSLSFPGEDKKPVKFSLASLSSGDGLPPWAQYVRGVLSLFPGGVGDVAFDAVLVSDVPIGGGLSSSAALEVSVFAFLQALTGRKVEDLERAKLCQSAERDFAGLPCGIMDQFISSTATEGHASLIDCRSLEARRVKLPASAAVLVTNSGVKHSLTGSEYPERQASTKEAAEKLGKPSLREVTAAELEAGSEKLSELLRKRARHVVGEIGRTAEAADALAKGDLAAVGDLMRQSHHSLRDDFEVSCGELDALVSLASSVEGVFGSRMTGGGFGGCTVTLCRPDAVEGVKEAIAEGYGARATFHLVRPAGGASFGRL